MGAAVACLVVIAPLALAARRRREDRPIFITPLALTIGSATGSDDALGLAGERVGDTLLGAAVALMVLWVSDRVWPRRRVPS